MVRMPGQGRDNTIRRTARVLDIIQWITLRPRHWSRRALAEHYGISERMIQKDLELIRYRLGLSLQRSEMLPDGRMLVKFYVGITPEMVNWLLYYGSRVQVLEPDWLRERVVEEHRRAAEVNESLTHETEEDDGVGSGRATATG